MNRYLKALRRLGAAAVVALMPLAAAPQPPAGGPLHGHGLGTPIRIGILTAMSRDRDFPAWASTIKRLHQALPEHPITVEPLDIAGVHRATVSGRFDFIILNPGLYTELERNGLRRLVSLKSPFSRSPERSLASAIFVRADRHDINHLSDLVGKRVEGVDRHGFGGWLVALREIRRHGLVPERDFAVLSFSGYPYRNTVNAVLDRRVDVGVVRACVIEQLELAGTLQPGELKVINRQANDDLSCEHSTQVYPDWLVAAVARTSSSLAREVSTALLTMPAAEDGFEWTMAGDYRPVDQLFRELELGRYANTKPLTVFDLIRRFWLMFAAVGVFAAAGILHVLLTQRTVRARTAELRRALDARDELERRQRAQQERIDHLARLGMLGEISSMVAHEINQPLAAIGSFARGLERRLQSGADPVPLATVARDIALQSERAGGIVQRIRSFARKRAVSYIECDLCAVARESLAMFSGIAERYPSIETRLPASAKVIGDSLQLQQVMVNLIKNALDAPRPPQATPWVGVAIEARSQHWRFVVEDNGATVGDLELDRFFEPFFTTKSDGLGLGLSICHGIIEAHGGRMLVQRRPTGGLSVGFELPELK